MRLFLIGFLAALPAAAQFTEIAASDDGSRVYASTQFVIDGVTNPALGPTPNRIFQIAPGPQNVFAQIDPASLLPLAIAQAFDPQISGDGSVSGYSISGFCAAAPCSNLNVESFLTAPALKDL